MVTHYRNADEFRASLISLVLSLLCFAAKV